MATKTNVPLSARQPQRGLTFDDVWAALMKLQDLQAKTDLQLQETREQIAATSIQLQETREQIAATGLQMQETDRRMQETDRQMQETDRRMQATDKRLGHLGNRMGEVVEWLMTPDLHKKFNEFGYSFNKMCRRCRFEDNYGHILAEADVFVENGDYALAVEVKTDLCALDIKDHVERMETIRRYADAHGDKRKFLGAVAAPNVGDSERRSAYRAGFFVIEPSEDAVEVLIPDGFKPKEW
jgi:hypothetical protein